MKDLFNNLFFAPTEDAVNSIIENHLLFQNPSNWRPYGDNESNFSVVENQQANPIAALVEKLTNAIDAMLMKKCYEHGIDPRSHEAPKNMGEAVRKFYKYDNFDVQAYRNEIAQDIQILADPNSPKLDTSLIIYDNGEGQHPKDFPDTFLSLLRGNKNDIKFVQGKYNMGGAGAVVYCGENRYQLIASKRYDNSGNFGFTLVRVHPLTKEEEEIKKNTYYEYFCPDGRIPEFPIDELDLNLYRRKFRTGTIIKLYSYDLPAGSRSVISRDLNQSINEYLHDPALPIFIIDRKERYPKDIGLERVMYGLSNRLIDQKDKYIDRQFTLEITGNYEVGKIRATVTVFKAKNDETSVKDFKDTIQREFFKNNMSVAFSLNGQVHGAYSSEFITRALKYKLLKDYLLIHVDCTNMTLHYRNNLFMASRDRLKNGKEADVVRKLLAENLRKSELNEVYKKRKDSFSADTSETNELLRKFSKEIPLNPEMLKLLKQTFKLEEMGKKKDETEKDKHKPENKPKSNEPFVSQRYPSIFQIQGKPDKDGKIIKGIPMGGDKTIRFSTDVENEYFDRIKDRGEMKMYILRHGTNITRDGNKIGEPKEIDEFFQVVKSSPQDGIIRVNLQPKDNLNVGDEIEIKAELTSIIEPKGFLETVFYVKIENMREKEPKPKEPEVPQIGLPQMVLVYKDEREGVRTWSDLEASGISFDDTEIMATDTNDKDELETIFINMDSSLLRSYKSKIDGDEALQVADNKYISQVYFHTLFLYSILKHKKIRFSFEDQQVEKPVEVEVEDLLRDLFKSSYCEFLLRFGGTEELISAID